MWSATQQVTAALVREADRDLSPSLTRGRHSLRALHVSVLNTTVLEWALRLATAGALIGHGAYGAFVQKPGWYGFFEQLGIGPTTVDDRSLMLWVGGFEIVLGAVALVAPLRAFLLFLFAWKMGTEFIWYPISGKPAWEFVERWSNYVAPLALLYVRGWPRTWRGWLR